MAKFRGKATSRYLMNLLNDKHRSSGAKALDSKLFFGTAEAVP
jgi:hypothetical protein